MAIDFTIVRRPFDHHLPLLFTRAALAVSTVSAVVIAFQNQAGGFGGMSDWAEESMKRAPPL